jgi:hypothetical protein
VVRFGLLYKLDRGDTGSSFEETASDTVHAIHNVALRVEDYRI